MLPTTQDYKISLMIGQDSFRTLENVEVIPNPNYPDEPWYATGGLAIVFKLKLKDKLYALKCFYNEANERQERLELVTAYLKQHPSPYFVDFTYLENELWVATDYDEGQGYPVVLMEWVEGKTLDNYLEQLCTQQNIPALRNLYFQFCNLAWWLQQQPIAHGDIKHDNLIVTPDGKLKLIDYDGVFVPAMRGRKANEMGSPCYQHPKRDAYFFDKNLDDFSLLILQITLLALQHQPKLFEEHYNGDGIILKDTDYQNVTQSSIKTILWQLPEAKIPLLLSQLQANLTNLSSIDLMPLLQDVAWINWLIGGQKDDKLEFERAEVNEIVIPFEKAFTSAFYLSEVQRLKKFILNEERWKKIFIDGVSSNYALDKKLIEQYGNKLKWDSLSRNITLSWSIDLIEKFKDRWTCITLSKNKSLGWSIELIKKYEQIWNWRVLSTNEALPWSIELIEQYGGKWDWGKLSENKFLPWSAKLIEKYEHKWDWELLSKNEYLPWSAKLIERYDHKWSWWNLTINIALPWSVEFLEQYKHKWVWLFFERNESLPWSVKLIEKYNDKWDWNSLGLNKSLPWSLELIEKYRNKWDWDRLSENESLPWSIELIEKYEGKWGWRSLSWNKSLPWSNELTEKYEDKWDYEYLSKNTSLPWSLELIEKYEDKWNWNKLSKNPQLPWSLELIEKYKDKWDWNGLSDNPQLPWSLELIEGYKSKWDWFELHRNKAIYEKVLQPLLTDEFIDEVMAEM